jgi:hypothetical protein
VIHNGTDTSLLAAAGLDLHPELRRKAAAYLERHDYISGEYLARRVKRYPTGLPPEWVARIVDGGERETVLCDMAAWIVNDGERIGF